ncbi:MULTISPECIES: hypothetical protein [unclassified Microcoleus]
MIVVSWQLAVGSCQLAVDNWELVIGNSLKSKPHRTIAEKGS